MTLAAGARLGPYEILGALGAGGMGEVYRARDSRLGRDVAIKVLPTDDSAGTDRLSRFEQEAKAAGALNHPNLLTVFDTGRHEGAPYIVFELLDGETLRERLQRGPAPLRKAIDWASQIAHGLAAAHERGIVHRDLKPENVFLTSDGRVKILDFGLAKLRGERAGTAGTDTPTESKITDAGVVVGTAGYMSPEQVRGEPVGPQSDVFSLGAVLYEMVSGRRAFQAATWAETMTAILNDDPRELTRGSGTVPPSLERVVRRCLEKRREERFQSARDLAFALEAMSADSGPAAAARAPATGGSRWGRSLALAAVAAAVAIAAFVAGDRRGFLHGKAAGERPVPSFKQVTFRRGTVGAARFTPDGQTIVYSAAWSGSPMEVFTTRSDSAEARPFGLAPAGLLAVSPSGEMAVSLRWRSIGPQGWGLGTLARLSLSGGTARELVDGVSHADWSRDGRSLAIVRTAEGRHRLEYPIGKPLHDFGASLPWAIRLSPREDRVAVLEGSPNAVRVVVVDLLGKETLLSGGWSRALGLAWSPSGEEVWFTGARSGLARELRAVSLTRQERLVARVPGTLTLHDISPDGRVLMAQDRLRREVMGLAPGAEKENDLTWLDYSWPVDLTPDGRMLLFGEEGQGGGGNLYLRNTDGSPAVRLGEGHSPAALSPDGKWVLTAKHGGPSDQLELLPTGAGAARAILLRGINPEWVRWFGDGRRLLITGAAPGHQRSTFVTEVGEGDLRPVTPEGTAALIVSPDGRDVLAVAPEGAPWRYPVDGGEPRRLAGKIEPDDVALLWSADGRSIYVARDGPTGWFFRFDLAKGTQEPWKELRPSDPTGVWTVQPLLITPDGKSYVYSFVRVLSDLYVVEGLR